MQVRQRLAGSRAATPDGRPPAHAAPPAFDTCTIVSSAEQDLARASLIRRLVAIAHGPDGPYCAGMSPAWSGRAVMAAWPEADLAEREQEAAAFDVLVGQLERDGWELASDPQRAWPLHRWYVQTFRRSRSHHA